MKLAANLMSTKPHNPDYCGLALADCRILMLPV